ncbi:MAG TPA: PQQ-binding-like beta-propeller repeat protein [Vicinamibacterales bacterium]|nr:PQQ-binding-like beta-propeller repeat protein [Vicinamibacterales bacterium]
MSSIRHQYQCLSVFFRGVSRSVPVRGGVLTGALVVSAVAAFAAADWPQWRGPNRDGIAAETGLLKTWPSGGPPLAWRAQGAGEGYSSFAVAGGRLFTLGARGDREYVLAYDAASGKPLWQTAHGRRFSNDRGSGPRGTPTVEADRVYAYGASGDLTVLEAATGRVLWTLNVLQKFGGSNIRWGLSESPLVLQDRILVNAGGRGASIVAVRKADGSLIWRSESDEPGYSSAVLAETGGMRQAVFFTGERALAVNVDDGRLLWSYDKVANRTANIATPIVRGNRVFLSSDYGTGAALLELSRSGNGVSAREVYFTRDMRNHHASSVLVGDHLYGFDSSILTAMHFDTGKVAWQNRSVGKGSLVFADDRLYLYSERGVVGLAEAAPDGYREHGRFQLQTGSLPTWAHPVVADGKLFLRDQDSIYAYAVRAR